MSPMNMICFKAGSCTTVTTNLTPEEALIRAKSLCEAGNRKFASTNKVHSPELEPYVQETLKAIAQIINEPVETETAFVSDESIIWDLGPYTTKEVDDLSKKLGFPIVISEYLWKVAQKLKDVREQIGEGAP